MVQKINNINFTVGISTSALEPTINKSVVDGIGHYTESLINNLKRSNINYKCFAFLKSLKKGEFENATPFDLSFLKYTAISFITHGKFFKFHPNVDLFHCTDYFLVPMKCPTISTLHDAISLIHPEWKNNTIRGKIAGNIIRQSAKCADHIITISEHAAKDICKYFKIKEKNISIIYPSIDDVWFQNIDAIKYLNVLKKYGLSEGYFLSVGTIQPRKNFGNLIDAYLSLPNSIRKERKLVIVGKYGWNAEELANRMKLLQEEGAILWLSNMDCDSDLRCIYKGAGVYIFPSLYEGFGLPILEAFASGVPVIISNHTSLPEVSGGAGIEINPEFIGEIAEAMELFSSNSKERAERIKLGKARAEEFRWKPTTEKLITTYKEVLNK